MLTFLKKIGTALRRISSWAAVLLLFLVVLFVFLFLWVRVYYIESSELFLKTPGSVGTIVIDGSAHILEYGFHIPGTEIHYPLRIRIPYTKTLVCNTACTQIRIPKGMYTIRSTNRNGYGDWSADIQIDASTYGEFMLPLRKLLDIQTFAEEDKLLNWEQETLEEIEKYFPGSEKMVANYFDKIALFYESSSGWNIFDTQTKTRESLLLDAESARMIKRTSSGYDIHLDTKVLSYDLETNQSTESIDWQDKTFSATLSWDGAISIDDKVVYERSDITNIFERDSNLIFLRGGKYYQFDMIDFLETSDL